MSRPGGWQWATALIAWKQGFAVVPPKQDGSKAPIGPWARYQEEPPSLSQVARWYSEPRDGVGLVCGRGSGGLEMFEFEGRAMAEGLYEEFLDRLEVAGLAQLWERIRRGYTETSPSGGFHVLYRVAEPRANKPLAFRPFTPEEIAEEVREGEGKKAKKNEKLLVEVKGQGGYTIISPSGGKIHPEGGQWSCTKGSLRDVVTISVDERDRLHEVAQSLHVVSPEEVRNGPRRQRSKSGNGERPGDAYNADPGVHAHTLELLNQHDWLVVAEREWGELLCRPGKDDGVSATLGYCGPGVLYVFSTSTHFEPGTAHSPFAVLAELEHGGNFSAAAAALLEQGYGSSAETGRTGETGALMVRRASDLTPRRAKFTLGGRLFLNHLNVLAGIGGQNKSTMTCEIAARASRGDLDGDLDGREMRVLIASAEDAAEEVILPRLIAAEADLNYIVLLDEPVALPEGAERLRETIIVEEIDLVIVDPLVAYLESDVDSHRDHSVRYAMATLKEIGEEHAVTSIAVMHLNKSRGSEVYERLSGSVGFFNAARSVLVLTPDPRTEDVGGHRVLWHAKCNAGPLAKPWECRIEPTSFDAPGGEHIQTLRLHFGEEVEGLKLSDGLNPSPESVSRKFEVQRWLQSELEHGDVVSSELFARGEDSGYSSRELRSAIQELNYYHGPGGFGGTWVVRSD